MAFLLGIPICRFVRTCLFLAREIRPSGRSHSDRPAAIGPGPLGSVSLFGLLRLATGKPSRELVTGELLRYLAEIAWAPDAVLANDHLAWSEINSSKLAVSARIGDVDGRVEISLNDEGMIAQVDAADRPRQEGAVMIERPWRGVFRDYRKVVGRIIPHAADVSWMGDGRYHCVWKGALTSWEPS